jgi:phosphonate transport system substrate-binding protein
MQAVIGPYMAGATPDKMKSHIGARRAGKPLPPQTTGTTSETCFKSSQRPPKLLCGFSRKMRLRSAAASSKAGVRWTLASGSGIGHASSFKAFDWIERMHKITRRRALVLAALSAGVSSSRVVAQATAPLEIGVLPNISARALMAQYQPMREFLQHELNRPVQISTAPNWIAFHQRTMAREYDVVITASHAARLAQVERGYVPMLVYVPDIKGMIAFASGRPMKGIADLRGQTLVLSNPQSLVTLRGLQWLSDNGLQKDRDFQTIDTPTDDSVGNVVVRGDAIAAMLSGGEFRAIPDGTKSQLQTLTTFAEVPGFVVMASPALKPSDQQTIKSLLLQFAKGSGDGKSGFGATGFSDVRELPPGLMESMDPFVAATRKLFSATP